VAFVGCRNVGSDNRDGGARSEHLAAGEKYGVATLPGRTLGDLQEKLNLR
jgi:hypothetical protein